MRSAGIKISHMTVRNVLASNGPTIGELIEGRHVYVHDRATRHPEAAPRDRHIALRRVGVTLLQFECGSSNHSLQWLWIASAVAVYVSPLSLEPRNLGIRQSYLGPAGAPSVGRSGGRSYFKSIGPSATGINGAACRLPIVAPGVIGLADRYAGSIPLTGGERARRGSQCGGLEPIALSDSFGEALAFWRRR
jgi:hypothetical protein